jgi:XTP/dITP diphosphohydrolase
MDVVIATRNKGKRREFEELAQGLGLRLHSLDEYPSAIDPEETGATFEENALIKARAAVQATGLWALADDSGLCVEALGGRPGIHSARYAEGSDQSRWQKLLSELDGVPEPRRGAAFVCVLALVGPQGESRISEGRCEGRIGFDARGEQGFGYDPVFLVAGDVAGRTMAELSAEEKHALSHRGRAFEAMRPHLASLTPGK